MAGSMGYKRTQEGPMLIITNRHNPPNQTDFAFSLLTFNSFKLTTVKQPQVIMFNLQNLDCKVVIMSLCIVHVLMLCEGRPLSKRTVSEVQLMHNLGEQKQVHDRRDWLQMRLRGIHTAPARGTNSGEAGRLRKRLRPEELPDQGDLTPEKIQNALKLFERILNSKQS